MLNLVFQLEECVELENHDLGNSGAGGEAGEQQMVDMVGIGGAEQDFEVFGDLMGMDIGCCSFLLSAFACMVTDQSATSMTQLANVNHFVEVLG